MLIGIGDAIGEASHRWVRAVCARLDERPIRGMTEYVPAFASVCVHYDAVAVGGERPYERIAGALLEALAELEVAELPPARTVEIPVCYGGEWGPDLEEVARRAGLGADEVARIHAGGDYRVHMIGFAPGFAYLAGLDERIAVPRHSTPRAAVPACSVGIGGKQTGIYPLASPGGWQIIGRTPLRLFALERREPALLRIGDRVRFRAISAEELRAMADGG